MALLDEETRGGGRSPSALSQHFMSEIIELTQGLQCCLWCQRTLTNRALHDQLEEPVLALIRTAHPEWSGEEGSSNQCLEAYRKLLADRLIRAEGLAASANDHRVPGWFSRLLGRNRETTVVQAVT